LSAISRLTRAGLRVTLVDAHLYSTFQPLLYQVATAGLNPGDVAYPAGGFAGRYGAIFRHGELAAIDPASRRITFTNGLELAWLSWLALHLFYLLGRRNRVSTMINLTYRYVACGHGGAVIVGDDPDDPSHPPAVEPGPLIPTYDHQPAPQ
jgi:NADH dehydrogenase FAD-containing subunit